MLRHAALALRTGVDQGEPSLEDAALLFAAAEVYKTNERGCSHAATLIESLVRSSVKPERPCSYGSIAQCRRAARRLAALEMLLSFAVAWRETIDIKACGTGGWSPRRDLARAIDAVLAEDFNDG